MKRSSSLSKPEGWAVALGCLLIFEGVSFAQDPAEATRAPAPPPPANPAPPTEPAAPPPPPTAPPPGAGAPTETAAVPPADDRPSDPFAFGDFSWLNGSNRQHKALLDSPIFTGSLLLDVNYTNSHNMPIDNTVVGSTSLSRNNEVTLAFLGFGGDFHYEHARARLMTQFGTRSVLVPRNDFSS